MGDYGERLEALKSELRGLGSLAVAYSGGVDSSVLLHAGFSVLGERCAGVIADSPSLPRAELAEAKRLAAEIGVRLAVIETAELEDPRYRANAGDRCYFCKAALFETMQTWAEREGFEALAFGEITDDAADDRPGARAAGERGVVAPLSAAGFGKEDVRRYAREAGLPVAEKFELGFRVLRVRHHGALAKVEVGQDELELARRSTEELERRLRACGFERFELGVYRSPA